MLNINKSDFILGLKNQLSSLILKPNLRNIILREMFSIQYFAEWVEKKKATNPQSLG